MSDNCVLLVRRAVKPGLPHSIWNQLFAETRKLLREGIAPEVLEAALKEWDARPGMGPAILPYIVSDVVRGKHRDQPRDMWEQQMRDELSG